MRKLLAAVGFTVAAAAGLAVAALVTFSGQAHAGTGCHLAVGAGRAFLTGSCPPTARVATYRYKDGAPVGDFFASFPQTLFDQGVNGANLPDCAWEADAFDSAIESAPPVIDATHDFGRGFLAGLEGGDHPCQPPVTTTTTPATTAPPPPTTVAVLATEIGTGAAPPPAAPTVAGVELARTGTSRTGWYEAIAAGLILAGLTALAVSRRIVNDALAGTRDA